jgi:hypothetical protein
MGTSPPASIVGSPSFFETSPSAEGNLDYHYMMWMAERGTNAPIGSPPREAPTPPASPCGCLDCEMRDNGSGELVCINCGVVTGALMSGIDYSISR